MASSVTPAMVGATVDASYTPVVVVASVAAVENSEPSAPKVSSGRHRRSYVTEPTLILMADQPATEEVVARVLQ